MTKKKRKGTQVENVKQTQTLVGRERERVVGFVRGSSLVPSITVSVVGVLVVVVVVPLVVSLPRVFK